MKRGGFYLIEVGIAIAVLAIVLTAFSSQLFIAYQSHTAAGRKNYAVFLAEEGIQALKNIRDQRFFDIATTTPDGVRVVEICPTVGRCSGAATGPGGRTWGLNDFTSSTKLSNTINSSNLQRRIVITQLDVTPRREKVKVRVEVVDWNGSYWPANRNPKVLVSLESAFENWIPTVINWKEILHIGDYDFDPPNKHDTRAAAVGDQYLLVTNSASGGKEFVLFNIARSPLITVSSTLNLDSNPNDLVYLSGFAYVASNSNSQEMQVVAVNLGSIVNRFGMDTPAASVIDTVNHRLFVSESDNNRVLVYDLDNSNTLLDRLPDYVLGQRNFFRQDSSTSQAGLRLPTSLAFDGVNSRLFVSDTSNHRVLVFNVSSVSTNMKASYVLGQPNFTTKNTAVSQSGMNSPRGVTYSAVTKQLFVADAVNNRTLVFNLGGAVSITNGQNAATVLGQVSFTANGAATTQSGMRFPYDVAYDSGGKRLFVADRDNHRVLYFNANNGIANGQNAFSVLGQTTFTAAATPSPPTDKSARGPTGVVFDGVGNRLFISDSVNNRVLVYNTNTISNGMAAQNVLGQPNFTSRAAVNPPTQSSLSDPRGLAYDSGNSRLFIADQGNHRVPIFDLAGGVSDGMKAANLLGQYDQSFNPDYTKNQTNNSGGNLQAILINTVDINGNDNALAVAAGGGIGNANCAGTCLFLGRDSPGGSNNFFVFDITVPADPVLIGSAALDGVPRSMAVNGNYVYVATDLSGGKGALIQVNVTVSSSPQQVWRYDDSSQMPTGRSIAVNPAGTRVALGTDGADAAGRDGIYLFDISVNPPALTNPSPNPFDDNNDWRKDDDVVKIGFVPSSHLLALIQRSGGTPDKIEALDVSGDAITYAASLSLPGALNSFVWSDLFMTAYVVADDDPEIKIIIPSSTYCPGC